jgi:hypothetical protein
VLHTDLQALAVALKRTKQIEGKWPLVGSDSLFVY